MRPSSRVATAVGASLAVHLALVVWLMPRARKPSVEGAQSVALIELDAAPAAAGARAEGAAAPRNEHASSSEGQRASTLASPSPSVPQTRSTKSTSAVNAPAPNMKPLVADSSASAPPLPSVPSAESTLLAPNTKSLVAEASPGQIQGPSGPSTPAPGASAQGERGASIGNTGNPLQAGLGTGKRGGSGSESVGGASGAVMDATAQLHALLARSAERCYPAQARRFRQSGEVTLRFCLTSGEASQVALSGTTGSALLDESARTCVLDGARPLPAITGCYEVPVRFGSR